MKGIVVSVITGILIWPMLPDHLILAVTISVVIPIVVLAFWCGAVSLKITKD